MGGSYFKKIVTDKFAILHMSQQLSCCDMCKFVISLDHQNQDYHSDNFQKISVMSSKVKWDAEHVILDLITLRKAWFLSYLNSSFIHVVKNSSCLLVLICKLLTICLQMHICVTEQNDLWWSYKMLQNLASHFEWYHQVNSRWWLIIDSKWNMLKF